MRFYWMSVALAGLLAGPTFLPHAESAADEPVPASKIDYRGQIQPLLAARCFGCHGPKKQESNLRLDVRRRALLGGDLGDPAIVPGKPKEGSFLRAIRGDDPDFRMPPEGKPLTAEQISLLTKWIEQGAVYPQPNATVSDRPTTDHWSFQPLRVTPPPAIRSSWIQGPIDAFILAELRRRQLEPSPAADRVMLVRRIFLDMHGLPPTAEQVAAFVDDQQPDAYRRLVERVLASPRYGERWGRHWLDVVRFAESHGFETNRERPNAFHYRDYVIEALNRDKPYQQFLSEQIAGDQTGDQRATGFLVAGPFDIVKSPDINLTLMQRQDELADIVNTTGTAMLGITIGCARCHNHKFDPVLQKDFYSMQAIFAGVQHGDRPLTNASAANRKAVSELETQIAGLRDRLRQLGWGRADARVNTERLHPLLAKRVRFQIFATNASQPCLDELEVYCTDRHGDPRNVALASAGGRPSSSGNLPGYAIHQLKHINDGKHGNSHSWISNENGRGWVQIEFDKPYEVDRVVWGRDRLGRFVNRLAIDYLIELGDSNGKWTPVAGTRYRGPAESQSRKLIDDLVGRLQEAEARLKTFKQQQFATAYSGKFTQPEIIHRLYRGEPQAKREVVQPDTLSVLGTLQLDNKTPESVRRQKLAEWITSPTNPLAPRVFVNRLWYYHFGNGIVASPSDFGANGQPPSHPQLLDWLAAELIRSKGSVKRLHRQILLSNTYRQTSHPRADGLRVDADCRLLWRFPPRRLEAEAIRDAILFASGSLRQQMGGPGFKLFRVQKETVHHYFPKDELGPDEWRRMVYMTKIRQEQDDVFGAFDCPDGNQTIPRRSRSTTPIQALNLLNSPFVVQQAELFAQRLQHDSVAGKDPVRRAFMICFARPPVAAEQQQAEAFVRQFGLPALCRALLNTNEFLFLP